MPHLSRDDLIEEIQRHFKLERKLGLREAELIIKEAKAKGREHRIQLREEELSVESSRILDMDFDLRHREAALTQRQHQKAEQRTVTNGMHQEP
jgi:hypothetical protein